MATAVDVTDLLRELEQEARRMRTAAGLLVLAAAKDDAPVSELTPTNRQPGRLRDSLRVIEESNESPIFSVTIGSDAAYAQYTDEVDTAPHRIEARNAPMLRFWWQDGFAGPGIYRFRFVNHPGTKGQHWFESKNQARWDTALNEVT